MPRRATRPYASRPRSRSPILLDLLARTRRSFSELSRWSRELIIFGIALIVGLVVVPLAIWFVGNRILGPYTHGTDTHAGALALLGDFFVGLGRGWPSYWIVAFGPAAIILLVRLMVALIRYQPQPTPPSGR